MGGVKKVEKVDEMASTVKKKGEKTESKDPSLKMSSIVKKKKDATVDAVSHLGKRIKKVYSMMKSIDKSTLLLLQSDITMVSKMDTLVSTQAQIYERISKIEKRLSELEHGYGMK